MHALQKLFREDFFSLLAWVFTVWFLSVWDQFPGWSPCVSFKVFIFLFGKRRKKMWISLSQLWRSSWKLYFSILADLSRYGPSCSITKSCLTACNPMDCGTPGFPVLHIRWRKCWSFRLSPSNEYSGLISLRIDWCDLLAVQGTLESLLQHHNLKTSILWRSAFFMVSPLYMTTGKTMCVCVVCVCAHAHVQAQSCLTLRPHGL